MPVVITREGRTNAQGTSAIKARTVNFTECRMSACGKPLPPERQTGGICADCAAPTKGKHPLAVVRFKVGDMGANEEPMPETWSFRDDVVTARSRSISHLLGGPPRSSKPIETKKIPETLAEDLVPQRSGKLVRVGPVEMRERLVNTKTILTPHVLARCDCGNELWIVAFAFARKRNPMTGCETCSKEHALQWKRDNYRLNKARRAARAQHKEAA